VEKRTLNDWKGETRGNPEEFNTRQGRITKQPRKSGKSKESHRWLVIKGGGVLALQENNKDVLAEKLGEKKVYASLAGEGGEN